MKNSLLILLMMFLTACGSLDYQNYGIHKELPLGSKIELTQQLVIPQDRMYVYIQYGEVVPFRNFNTVRIYDPYCRLSLGKENPEAVTVSPDTFTVTKITEWEDYHGAIPSRQPVKLASANLKDMSLSRVLSSEGDRLEAKTVIMYATIIGLRSEKHPAVKELVCGHWDFDGIVEPLTLAQIRSALGNVMNIKVAAK